MKKKMQHYKRNREQLAAIRLKLRQLSLPQMRNWGEVEFYLPKKIEVVYRRPPALEGE